MIKHIKRLFTIPKKDNPNKPSEEHASIKIITTYCGASKEEIEFWRNERNNTWKDAEQLIGKPIKLLEIKNINHVSFTWGEKRITCTKKIYDAEILCVDGATVKYKTSRIDNDGNYSICNRWTCLHDNQKFAIMDDNNN